MGNDHKVTLRYGAIVLLALVVIGGGYMISKGQQSKVTPAKTAAPKAKTVKTKKQVFDLPPPPVTNLDIRNAFIADDNAVIDESDHFFNNAGTDPKLTVKTKTDAIRDDIELKRKEMTQTLNDWQNLVKKNITKPNEVASPEDVTLANQYADTIHDYIDELHDIVTGLTPENSGLTPEEIAADIGAVDIAVAEAEDAINTLQNPGLTGQDSSPSNPSNSTDSNPPNSNQNNSNPSNPADTFNPPDSSNPLDSSGQQPPANNNPPDTTNPGSNPNEPVDTGSNDYVPPPAPPANHPDTTGAPRLIEGTNPIQ